MSDQRFSKAELPANSVMLTVKAADGTELGTLLNRQDSDGWIASTFRSLIAACEDYDEHSTQPT